MEHTRNMVKKLHWQEANPLAIYKYGLGVELGTTKNNSSQCSEWDLNLEPLDFKSGALTIQPRYENC